MPLKSATQHTVIQQEVTLFNVIKLNRMVVTEINIEI